VRRKVNPRTRFAHRDKEVAGCFDETVGIRGAGEANVGKLVVGALTGELGFHPAGPQCLEEISDALIDLNTV